MKIIVPMAGRGSRFSAAADQNPEYRKPKPLISVKGKPMVIWAVESLPFVDLPHRPATTKVKATPKDLVFICLQQHEDEFQITKVLKEHLTDAANVVLIPEVTRGATETVLAAKEYIDMDDDLIITDSDHFFNGMHLYDMIIGKDADTMGMIPVFEPPDDEVKWSYTLFDKDHTALAVAEKDPVLAAKGAYANIGCYCFSKGRVFVDEAEAMIREGDKSGAPGKEEFYIAPMYQRLINKGMKIKAAIIPQMWGLGTPKDLEYFLANY